LPILLPDGTLGTGFLSFDHRNYIWKGPEWKYRELQYIVPGVLEKPRHLWRGIRHARAWEEVLLKDGWTKEMAESAFDPDWWAYTGVPKFDFDGWRGAKKVPYPPGYVFLVCVNEDKMIYIWLSVKADPTDPTKPEGHEKRFLREYF